MTEPGALSWRAALTAVHDPVHLVRHNRNVPRCRRGARATTALLTTKELAWPFNAHR
jgi:hypothetical protein